MFNNKGAQLSFDAEQDSGDFDFFNKLLASIDNADEVASNEVIVEEHQALEDPAVHQVLKIPP